MELLQCLKLNIFSRTVLEQKLNAAVVSHSKVVHFILSCQERCARPVVKGELEELQSQKMYPSGL